MTKMQTKSHKKTTETRNMSKRTFKIYVDVTKGLQNNANAS